MTNIYFVCNENSAPEGSFGRWDFEAITNDRAEADRLAATLPNATGRVLTSAEIREVNQLRKTRGGRRGGRRQG